jgi:hypothetical protein
MQDRVDLRPYIMCEGEKKKKREYICEEGKEKKKEFGWWYRPFIKM